MSKRPGAQILFLCTGNYFRSRYAELLFNHLAARAQISAQATSAGLAPRCETRNPGPISPHTVLALMEHDIVLTLPRAPRDVTVEDLASASLIIALKEDEHRPLVEKHFPAWSARIRYWDVDDVPHVSAKDSLEKIERLLSALLNEFV